MKVEKKRPGRAMMAAAVLLLLGATHVGLYWVARGFGRNGGDRDRGATAAENAAPVLPGKSVDRDKEEDAGKSLARLGPGGMRALLEELGRPEAESGLTRDEYQQLRAELFREWLRRDLRSALDLLCRPENEVRYRITRSMLSGEIDAEIARHPDEVLGWIAQRRYGSNTEEMVQRWARTLLDRGQVAVVLRHLDELPGLVMQQTLDHLLRFANAEQLAEVQARMASLDPRLGRFAVVDSYASRKLRLWAESGNGDLAALFAGEVDADVRECLMMSWVSCESPSLAPREAVAGLMKLPEDLREQAAGMLLDEDRRGGYAARVDLLEALDQQGLIGDVSEQRVVEMIESALREGVPPPWDKDAPAKLLELARGIQRDALRRALLTTTLRYPAYADADDLLEAAPGLPAGGDRDAMLATVARSQYVEAETREKLLAWVGDESLKEEVRKEAKEREGEEE